LTRKDFSRDRLARAMALDRILDRGYGKPPQLNTTDRGQFRRAADLCLLTSVPRSQRLSL
jgi:hypothetical protein